MDVVTGTQVSVTLTVPLTPEQVWQRITDVPRIGEWSPEATAATWDDPAATLAPGVRFTGHNRFPNGFETTVTCEVTAVDPAKRFAWSVSGGDGNVFAVWDYDLQEGDRPGTTTVRHTFTHGPGNSGPREQAAKDPRALNARLGQLAANMGDTILAMAAAQR